MKLKHLESALSSVPTQMFPSPKITLEQYPTNVFLVASIMFTAMNKFGDVGPELSVCDLGCGTGMLGIGAALMECDHVIMVDCDLDAITVAQENVREMELEDTMDFVLAKVNYNGGGGGNEESTSSRQQQSQRGGRGKGLKRGGRGRGRSGGRGRSYKESTKSTSASASLCDATNDGIPLKSKCIDTVFTNPPFGTKHNAGIDVQFLYTATRLARRAVYSFHKSSTREYLVKKCRDEWNLDVQVVAKMQFDIPNMYKFHTKKSVDVDVDLIRVSWPETKIEKNSNDNDDDGGGD
mmetsp:Transcript_7723/g.11101  ORF Transcript_7723/g.11101 Transcript_7723/m.11101 type:complete len:294 (+) Transcript_7723:82-963(+)